MKRLSAMLLAALMLLSILPLSALAAESEAVAVGSEAKGLGGLLAETIAPEVPVEPEAPAETASPTEELLPVPTEEPAPAEEPDIPIAPTTEEESAETEVAAEAEPPVSREATGELRALLAHVREDERLALLSYTEQERPLVLTGVMNQDGGDGEATQPEEGYVASTEAVELIRNALTTRSTSFSAQFYVEYDASLTQEELQQVGNAMLYAAMQHTGNPKQGDYIEQNLGPGEYAIEIGSDGAYFYYFTITYTMSYLSTPEQEAAVDAAVVALLTELNLSGKTDYEKICAVYDWMTANIVYDYAGLEDESDKLEHSTYAAIVEKSAVCQGYSSLFYRLMLELGIDARVITGYAGEAHSWNIVKLGDLYYALDSTWDAEIAQAGMLYKYFLKGENKFYQDHTRDEEYISEEFVAAYPMSDSDYSLPLPEPPGEDESVAIDAMYFPDEIFRDYVLRKIDTDGDRWLSPAERESVTTIDVSYDQNFDYEKIASLRGVELFQELRYLDCRGNDRLQSLDLSGNLALESLYCGNSVALEELNISNNAALQVLVCEGASIMELDLSGNGALEVLRCGGTAISELDVSGNPKLRLLYCSGTAIAGLDVSGNEALEALIHNGYIEIDLEEDGTFDLSGLPGFDVTKAGSWSGALVEGNILTPAADATRASYTYDCGNGFTASVTIAWAPELGTGGEATEVDKSDIAVNEENFPDTNFRAYIAEIFDANANGILSWEERSAVTNIAVDAMSIGSLEGIEHFPNLEILSCGDNLLTSLDVSKNKKLMGLYCEGNQLEELILSPSIGDLWCSKNRLKELDLSQSTVLGQLYCEYNQLTELDLSHCTALQVFGCRENRLTSLDVSNCLYLDWMMCSYNELSSLDVSNNPLLRELYCDANCLEELDVNSCVSLEELSCGANWLVSLDVSKNPSLTDLTADFSERPVTLNDDGSFKLSNLPASFDESKVQRWVGGTVRDGVLYADIGTSKTYIIYDCGRGYTISFALAYDKQLCQVHSPGVARYPANYVGCVGGYKQSYRLCTVCGSTLDENGRILEWEEGDGTHGNLIKHDLLLPTYEEWGNLTYWSCEGCNTWYEDAEGTVENLDVMLVSMKPEATMVHAETGITMAGDDTLLGAKSIEVNILEDISAYRQALGDVPIRAIDVDLRNERTEITGYFDMTVILPVPEDFNGRYCQVYYGNGDSLEKAYSCYDSQSNSLVFRARGHDVYVLADMTPEYILGDADGNGKVNARDATVVLRYDARVIDETGLNMAAADVDGNGKVNARDATYILRKDAGVITHFPAEAAAG